MALLEPIGTDIPEAVVGLRLEQRKRDVSGSLFKGALMLALFLAVATLAVLLVQVLVGGWSVVTERGTDFITSPNRSRADEAGLFQALRGSFWIAVAVVLIAFPIGIGAGVYLEEFAKHGKLRSFIDLNIRNLAGVPSIVYGILGFTILVKTLGSVTGGKTTLTAGLTVAILVLPIVIITTAEAVRAVPSGLREAGFGIGATHWEVIRYHVLPYAAPGVLTGTVLALARALGEAAPLLLVGAVEGKPPGANASFFDPAQLTQGFTALPVLIADWSKLPDQDFRANTAAAIIVMLVVVLAANTFAIVLRNKFERQRQA